jgi:hypothetical protein
VDVLAEEGRKVESSTAPAQDVSRTHPTRDAPHGQGSAALDASHPSGASTAACSDSTLGDRIMRSNPLPCALDRVSVGPGALFADEKQANSCRDEPPTSLAAMANLCAFAGRAARKSEPPLAHSPFRQASCRLLEPHNFSPGRQATGRADVSDGGHVHDETRAINPGEYPPVSGPGTGRAGSDGRPLSSDFAPDHGPRSTRPRPSAVTQVTLLI